MGVTQSGSLVDTWVCMCGVHVHSGLFYEVIVLSSVRPLTGQHWRVPAVCWRAHNVTRNSSCPTAMQHRVLQKPSARHYSELSSPVHTDPVPSLPYSISPCVLYSGPSAAGTVPPKYTLQSNFKAITDEYGPGSSVGIGTDYGLDGPGIEARWGEIFRPSRPALGPTQPLQWVPGHSRG